MVGNEDVRLVGLQVFASLHLNGQKEDTGNDARPPAARIITPEMAVAQRAADADEEGRPDGHYNGNGNGNENLIYTVKYSHIYILLYF
jgi:hypothetical protein